MMSGSLQAKFQSSSAELQKLQNDLSNFIEAKQKLDAQLSENELVKKEFATLTSDNRVFKLVGPVLVRQDQAEAKHNVDTRLEFISGEIKRVESEIKDTEGKQEGTRKELMEIQAALQRLQDPQTSNPTNISNPLAR